MDVCYWGVEFITDENRNNFGYLNDNVLLLYPSYYFKKFHQEWLVGFGFFYMQQVIFLGSDSFWGVSGVFSVVVLKKLKKTLIEAKTNQSHQPQK